jgi:NADPH-dependent ferric siderophore reductase
MDDAIARPVAARPPLSEAEIERRRGRPWSLRVTGVKDITPNLRRVQLTADDLAEFKPKPAQEIVRQIPQEGPEPARRHYTIRRYDPATGLIDVDFVLHGAHAPAVRWALDAKPGQAIDIRGPRGRIALSPSADWHLMSGDETAMPAILALAEALPTGAKAHLFLEIGGPEDKMPVESQAEVTVTWLSRHGAPAAPSRLLPDAIDAFTLLPGKGHAIIIGETSTVRAQRHALIARGFTRDQIYSEGYWRPGRIGGHDHVEE